MTDPTVIAASIVTVIAALTAATVSIINAWSAASERTQAKAARMLAASSAAVTIEKTDEIIQKTDQIHLLTNSQLDKVTAKLAVANEKIDGMEKLIAAVYEKQNGRTADYPPGTKP